MKIRKSIYCLVVTLTFLVIFLEYGCSARTSIRWETKAGEKVKFYLVGIGPGDADLITLRGLKAIEDADLIVCSKRAQEKFAAYLRGKEIFDTSRLYKSSRKDYIDLTEEELNIFSVISNDMLLRHFFYFLQVFFSVLFLRLQMFHLGEKTVEASAGGGMVSVVANGKQDLLSIKIDRDVVDPEDVEMLEDLVMAAVNDALTQARDMMNEGMGELTKGMNIPGMPGLT